MSAGPEIIALGNGQILLRGMAVVDSYRAVQFAISNSRRRDGLTAPLRLVHLERALAIEAMSVASRGDGHPGRPSTPISAVLIQELIDTEEVAEMLQLSTRQVRRLAADLGGRRVSGRWRFDPLTVVTYAESRAA